MQQLHLVGFTTDLDQLILSARKGAKSGSFLVPLDERLLEEIAEAIRRRNDGTAGAAAVKAPPELTRAVTPTRRSSRLSPREIQARLRAGRSIPDVAEEANAEEEWVAKFAPPVMAERNRVVQQVRDLVFTKSRRGESAEPLGASVRWNLLDRGIRMTDDEFDGCWSASHVTDSTWSVSFDYVSRGRRQHAEWDVDLQDRELLARNRVASDLGYVESGRRRRSTAYLPPKAKAASKTARATPTKGKKAAKSTGASASGGTSSRSGSATASANGRGRRTATAAKRGGTSRARAGARTRTEGPPAPSTRTAAGAAAARRGTAAPLAPELVSRTAPPPRAPVDELTRRRLELVRNATRDAPPPVRGARAAPARPAPRPAPAARPREAPVAADDVSAGPAAESVTGSGPDGRSRDREATGGRGALRPQPRDRDRAAFDDATVAKAERAAEAGGSGAEAASAAKAAEAAEAALAFPSASQAATAAGDRRRTQTSPGRARAGGTAGARGGTDDDAARRRREERRQARAAARAAAASVAAPAEAAEDGTPGAGRPAIGAGSARPTGAESGRVVTIRANRAGAPGTAPATATSPPASARGPSDGDEDGDVVVRGARPLRPALPASQPRRRRFGRTR